VVEDDMQVRIIWRDGNSTVAAIRQAWFKPSRFVSDTPSTCTGIGAFELSGARLLLWIRYDGRPHFDHLAVLLVDLTQQVVLDAIEDLGEIAWPDGQAVVLTRAGHFESLLIKESLLDRIGGGEFGRPDWMTVTVTGKKLRAQWRN
jgi:hypothetical protein